MAKTKVKKPRIVIDIRGECEIIEKRKKYGNGKREK